MTVVVLIKQEQAEKILPKGWQWVTTGVELISGGGHPENQRIRESLSFSSEKSYSPSLLAGEHLKKLVFIPVGDDKIW